LFKAISSEEHGMFTRTENKYDLEWVKAEEED
jgi:hypothetical protein